MLLDEVDAGHAMIHIIAVHIGADEPQENTKRLMT